MSRPPYSKLYQISDLDFSESVQSAQSYSAIVKKCKKGNINAVKRRIKLLGLDDTHIPKSNKGRVFKENQISLDTALKEIFVEGSKCKRATAKIVAMRYNLIPYKCKCGLADLWESEKLILQLEHKNGISDDYRINNLCFLCPNCHSQTKTFGGKNLTKTFDEYNTIEFKMDCSKLSSKKVREKYKITYPVLTKICNRLSIKRPAR